MAASSRLWSLQHQAGWAWRRAASAWSLQHQAGLDGELLASAGSLQHQAGLGGATLLRVLPGVPRVVHKVLALVQGVQLGLQGGWVSGLGGGGLNIRSLVCPEHETNDPANKAQRPPIHQDPPSASRPGLVAPELLPFAALTNHCIISSDASHAAVLPPSSNPKHTHKHMRGPTFWSQVRRQPNSPSMFSARCGSLPALGMTATPRCTFHLSSTWGNVQRQGVRTCVCSGGGGVCVGRGGAGRDRGGELGVGLRLGI